MTYKKITLAVLVALILTTQMSWASGERPSSRKKNAQSQTNTPEVIKPTEVVTSPSAKFKTTANDAKTNTLTEDEIADLHRAYKEQITLRQFSDALSTLQKIPNTLHTDREKSELSTLLMFNRSDEAAEKSGGLFQKEDDADDNVKKVTQKLYREAQSLFVAEKPELAKDLLIQILFVNRRNAKAKKLLEYGLNLKTGDYKIEDIEEKYWSKSSTLFYGGNYGSAIDALNILVLFDKENPLVYERMGSSYYMMGEKRRAIESWNTALFFNPNNKDLQVVVERAKKVLVEDEKDAKDRPKNAKKIDANAVPDTELQLMGIYKTQGEAYNFATELKKQNLNAVVEEQDTGKWTVKVPKSQLKK